MVLRICSQPRAVGGSDGDAAGAIGRSGGGAGGGADSGSSSGGPFVKIAWAAAMLATALDAQTVLRVRPQPSVNQTTIEVPLEKYVAAVLAGEASVLRSDEALK